MILTCPNCGTQYAVKDGAIPALGRQVRCASCKHSWHQDPAADGSEAVDPADTAPNPPPAEESGAPDAGYAAFEQVPEAPSVDGGEDESFAEATLIEPRSGPDAEERAFEEAAIAGAADYPDQPSADPDSATPADGGSAAPDDWREPPEPEPQSDDYVPFQESDDFDAPKRRWLPILLVLLLVAALSAAFWFLAPVEWKAQLGLVESTSPLALVTTHMDRQRLESGNELLTITGRVINPTGKEQTVPPLSAQLRAPSGKVVYSWTIAPPARSLAPGASASFNSAEVNVPPGGEELTITLGGNRG